MRFDFRKYLSAIGLTVVLSTAVAQPSPDDQDPWGTAIRQRDLETLDAMLELGADPQRSISDGKTALMIAAQADDERLVQRLLDAGAAVDATNANGGTALMYAAIDGAVATTNLLLAKGADPNAEARFGWTALMVAAVKGRSPMSATHMAGRR
jgi:ankyrin repeat protein